MPTPRVRSGTGPRLHKAEFNEYGNMDRQAGDWLRFESSQACIAKNNAGRRTKRQMTMFVAGLVTTATCSV